VRGLKVTLDISNILLGTGFALFIALLAWGDQIRKPRKDVAELEESFRKEFDLKKKVFNPLLRTSDDKSNDSPKYSFFEQTKAMVGVIGNKKLKGENVKLLSRFKELNVIRNDLEKKYNYRYLLTLYFLIVLFVLGIASLFTSNVTITLSRVIVDISYIYLGIVIVFIILFICNFFSTHNIEDKFVTKIYDTDDNIEAE
jgi:hypothetical protein